MGYTGMCSSYIGVKILVRWSCIRCNSRPALLCRNPNHSAGFKELDSMLPKTFLTAMVLSITTSTSKFVGPQSGGNHRV